MTDALHDKLAEALREAREYVNVSLPSWDERGSAHQREWLPKIDEALRAYDAARGGESSDPRASDSLRILLNAIEAHHAAGQGASRDAVETWFRLLSRTVPEVDGGFYGRMAAKLCLESDRQAAEIAELRKALADKDAENIEHQKTIRELDGRNVMLAQHVDESDMELDLSRLQRDAALADAREAREELQRWMREQSTVSDAMAARNAEAVGIIRRLATDGECLFGLTDDARAFLAKGAEGG